MNQQRRIFILAGPNGAGKTTTALSINPDHLHFDEFINADEIARGLAPLHPESMALTASKLMLKRLKDLLQAEQSFAFETTGAGTNYIKYLKEARATNYEITLFYLWLSSADLAVNRVAQRIAQGGHSIPEETIKRRYWLGQKNLIKYYLPLVDRAFIVDNSKEGKQNLIAEWSNHQLRIIIPELWTKITNIKL